MKVYDVLKKKTFEIDRKNIIEVKKKNFDYILSIPHSGTLIPSNLKHKYIINKRLLIGSDLHTEKVYNTKKGISIIFRLNPYVVDMNRFKFGSKDKSLPKHLRLDALHRMPPSQPLLKEEYLPEEKERILKLYDKYHNFIQKSIKEMKRKHGCALMFDCHSMSSVGPKSAPDKEKRRPDFSIGTLNGNSANKEIISTFYKTLSKKSGKFYFEVKKDHPYNGGAITRKYSKPSDNVHVIQVEVNESIFMVEGIDDDYPDDFKIKKKNFKRINLILSKAFKETFKKCKKIN